MNRHLEDIPSAARLAFLPKFWLLNLYFKFLNLILKPALACSEGKSSPEDCLNLGIALARPLKFVFQFPPIHGVFDAGYGVVYIFGWPYEGEIEDIIVHETLHYVLLRVAGKRASLKLDKICAQLEDEKLEA